MVRSDGNCISSIAASDTLSEQVGTKTWLGSQRVAGVLMNAGIAMGMVIGVCEGVLGANR